MFAVILEIRWVHVHEATLLAGASRSDTMALLNLMYPLGSPLHRQLVDQRSRKVLPRTTNSGGDPLLVRADCWLCVPGCLLD